MEVVRLPLADVNSRSSPSLIKISTMDKTPKEQVNHVPTTSRNYAVQVETYKRVAAYSSAQRFAMEEEIFEICSADSGASELACA